MSLRRIPASLATDAEVAALLASLHVIAGAGLSGGGALSSDVTLSLPDLLGAGTAGGGALIPILTWDAKGRLTGVATATNAPAWASITGKPATALGFAADAMDLGSAQTATGLKTFSNAGSVRQVSFKSTAAGVNGQVWVGGSGDRDGANTFDKFIIYNGALNKFVTVQIPDTGDPILSSSTAGITAASVWTFANAPVFSAGFSAGASSSISQALAGSVSFTVTNTSNATTASASVAAINDAGVAARLNAYGSGFTTTIFGLVPANYGGFFATGASLAGVLIGQSQSASIPVIFGQGSNEVARFTSGTIASGTFSLKYTTDSADLNTGSFVTPGGAAFGKVVSGGNAFVVYPTYGTSASIWGFKVRNTANNDSLAFGFADSTYSGTIAWTTNAQGMIYAPSATGLRIGVGTGATAYTEHTTTAFGVSLRLDVKGGLTFKRTTFSNANVTAVAGDLTLAQIGTMSASRTVTLPAANIAGQIIEVMDESGTVTGTFTLVVTRAGTDTINGATTDTLSTAYASARYQSNGAGKWTKK